MEILELKQKQQEAKANYQNSRRLEAEAANASYEAQQHRRTMQALSEDADRELLEAE